MTGALAMLGAYGGPGLTATPYPASVAGNYHGASSLDRDIATGSATLDVQGGVAPFTYLWAMVGVSAYSWTIFNATAVTTSFTALAVEEGAETSASFVCTVTDSLGASVVSSPVSATVRNDSTA